MKRSIQKFSTEYLESCRQLKPHDILTFLEDFRLLHSNSQKDKSKLISIKIPRSLLEAFRKKALLNSTPYQTQIKKLMMDWLSS